MSYPDPYMDLYNASAHVKHTSKLPLLVILGSDWTHCFCFQAIKAVSPSLKIGGPATMQTQHLVDFVNRARSIKAPLDFVSSHLYPSEHKQSGLQLGAHYLGRPLSSVRLISVSLC